MRVQFGPMVFTKTKFDGLDGKVVVAFTNGDDTVSSRATPGGITLNLGKFEAEDAQGVTEIIHTVGALVDATWEEHKKLRPKLHATLSGH